MALYNITTKDEFTEKVVDNKNLVLVDFWADWCPPCRAMTPILEAIANDMDGVDVVKVDIEASSDNNWLASKHDVRGIPNMRVYKDGQIVDELVGMRPQAVLEDELRAHL